MSDVALSIEATGPFFTRDPGKTLRGNIRAMMQAVAEEGERAVQARYPVRTGEGRAGVRGRAASLSGKPWMATAVISQTHAYAWKNGGKKRYLGGKTERRYHMFRDTYRELRNARAVLSADLTRGIA